MFNLRLLASLCIFNYIEIFVKRKFALVKYSSKISIIYHQIKSERHNEQVFYKKAVFQNFAIFAEKLLYWGLFLNENTGLQSWNFIKKWLQHKWFPANIAKFLRTTALKNICERLFEHFATWANNITSSRKWRRHFSSARRKKRTFAWCSWSFRFSLFLHYMSQVAFSLHNKRWY